MAKLFPGLVNLALRNHCPSPRVVDCLVAVRVITGSSHQHSPLFAHDTQYVELTGVSLHSRNLAEFDDAIEVMKSLAKPAKSPFGLTMERPSFLGKPKMITQGCQADGL